MQALILAGGEGTRLRPLTTNLPKPVVPLVNRPFITYMLDWLKLHGVEEVVISTGFMAQNLRGVLGEEEHDGLRLRYVEEQEPLGTAGAVKHAEQLLHDRFLVLNGDVLTDIDLGALVDFHESARATATIALTPVDDPSVYGLVRTDADCGITEFLEKPSPNQIDTNLINAGAYFLERDVLDMITAGANTSFERDVFPKLVGGGLYGVRAAGYWLDIGTPDRYLQGTYDILERNVHSWVGERMDERFVVLGDSVDQAEGARVVPPAVVGERANLGSGARVGSLAVVGDHCFVDENALVERAVVQRAGHVGRDCVIRESILAAGVHVGEGTHVEGGAVIGEGAVIGAGNFLTNAIRIGPGIEVPHGAIRF